ncbi:MAG: hypothetical protein AAGI11_03655 [Pseudomonadota bacterium]
MMATGVAALLALLLGGGAYLATDVGPKAARMTTRWVCPCVFVEQRELQACVDDMVVNTTPITRIELDPGTESATATALLFFESRATRVPGQSCRMEY